MSELTKPLQGKPPRRIGGISIVGVLLTLLGLVLVGAVVVTIVSWDPGTPPTASTPIETVASTGDVVIRAPEEGGGNAGVTITTPDGLPANGAGVVIREVGGATPVALSTEVNPALLESGHYGPIPRIGPDGLRPLDAYLRPLPPAGITGRPRIAIIIGGVGLGRAGTQQAIDVLPPEVSLALAPYGGNLRMVAADARAAGHEIFLQVPLEPFDFPANDPGEHTLIVDDPVATNIDRLEWLMTQFSMYAGIVTYAGGRFTGEADALQPVVDELARRGLMFVDDGASARSVTADVSVGVVPYARADLVIDTVDDQTAVANRLAQLEALAQQRGFAIGSGSAFPNTIEAVRAWAATALARGFEIVPVTALRVDPLQGTLIQVP